MTYSYVKGKVEKAAEINRNLQPIFSALFVVSNPCPLKWALNQVGFNVGKPRLPLVEPDEKSQAIIRDALKKTKIDLPVK
jgi:4-hydroxy-tetrahydrodipicolinate synthase